MGTLGIPWTAERRLQTAKRHGTVESRFMARVEFDPFGGCWLWTGGGQVDEGRYGVARLNHRLHPANRVSWMIFRGPIPEGLLACHKCDVPACVNPQHLFLGTHSDNALDSVRKGRRAHLKPRPPSQKLEPHQAAQIAIDLALGTPPLTLAERFGVSEKTVTYILQGRTWSEFTGVKHISAGRPVDRVLTHDGRTQPLRIWAEEIGLTPTGLRMRLERGWAVSEAVTTLPQDNRRAS